MLDPQSVMNLVQVKLENNDAYSSIRGVFGGVGFTLLAVFTWLVPLSRMIKIASEGALGDFGSQWLVIESTLCVLALAMFSAERSKARSTRFALAQ